MRYALVGCAQPDVFREGAGGQRQVRAGSRDAVRRTRGNAVASATVPNGDAAASQIARRLDIEVLGLLHHAAGRVPSCGTSVPENALAQPAGGLACAQALKAGDGEHSSAHQAR